MDLEPTGPPAHAAEAAAADAAAADAAALAMDIPGRGARTGNATISRYRLCRNCPGCPKHTCLHRQPWISICPAFRSNSIPEEKLAADKHEAAAPIADLHLPDIGAPEHQPLEMHVPEIHVPEVHAPAAHEPEMLPDLGMHLDTGSVDLDTGVDGEYSNSAEMATKLDLAAAYQEIGDKEGARELLDEVIKGGTPEQSEKAHSLLVKLG